MSMTQEVLIENEEIKLVNYTPSDDRDLYGCWLNLDTQKGYNYVFSETFEEFVDYDRTIFKFWVTIVDIRTNHKVGVLRLGPQEKVPDLAIWIYPTYRKLGYAYKAYKLALAYLFNNLNYHQISAGVYEDNIASRKLMTKLGFKRNPQMDQMEENAFTNRPTIQMAYLIEKVDFLNRQ